MKITFLCSSVLLLFISILNFTLADTNTRKLSRHKRYVVFPEGSSLTVAFCITMNLIEVPTVIFTELINIGINYDLPNTTIHLKSNDESKEMARRRHRRDLYNKVEIILNAMGYDGKACIYRALCEVVQIINSQKGNMFEEIIRRLFSFPLQRLHYTEPEEHKFYHWAHEKGHANHNCYDLFPNCHISLIDVLLNSK